MSSDWDGFFTTVAQVAVTAFSIMFLAIQVRSRVWRGKPLLSVAALASLVELFVPLLISLITVMARHPWRVAAIVAGGLGLAMVVAHWVVYSWQRRKEEPSKFSRVQIWGSFFSLTIYCLVILSAANPFGWGLYLLAAMCVWLLISGSFEAWWLLEPKGISNSSTDDQGSDRAQ